MSPLRDREQISQKAQERRASRQRRLSTPVDELAVAHESASVRRRTPQDEERRHRKNQRRDEDSWSARSRSKLDRWDDVRDESKDSRASQMRSSTSLEDDDGNDVAGGRTFVLEPDLGDDEANTFDGELPMAVARSLEDDDGNDVAGGRTFVLEPDLGDDEANTFDGELPMAVARGLRDQEEDVQQGKKRRVPQTNGRANSSVDRKADKRRSQASSTALALSDDFDGARGENKRGKNRNSKGSRRSEAFIDQTLDGDFDDKTPPPEEVIAQQEATQSTVLPRESLSFAKMDQLNADAMASDDAALAQMEDLAASESGDEEGEEALDEDSPEYIQAKFEIPEDAPIDVVIWVTIKQVAYMILVFLRNHIRPLRGRLDRWIIRTKAQNASRNAQLTVQERRVSWIIMGSLLAFVLGSAAFIGVGLTREKLPDELVIKLLYPYGFQDGVLNNRRYAGYSNVEIEYVGKTVCNEGVEGALPDCYAYEYRAKKLEGFEGKMIVGKNMNGQWELFNPPKDVAAARQAATQRMQKRYAKRR